MLAVALGTLGLAYASVPLYRIFCQTTGFGGTPKKHGGGGAEDGYDLPRIRTWTETHEVKKEIQVPVTPPEIPDVEVPDYDLDDSMPIVGSFGLD